MGFYSKSKIIQLAAASVGNLAFYLLVIGCGTPGAPQPPSHKLPERVTDLSAERAGNVVTLHWTLPRKNTDHLLISGPIETQICRVTHLSPKPASPCERAGVLSFDPGSSGTFQETLPDYLAIGRPSEITYFVELKNHHGHSAGMSNDATVLAGAAPAAVNGLTAEVRADGVALHWEKVSDTDSSFSSFVRLHRKLTTPQKRRNKADSGPMSAPAEPVFRDLLVDSPDVGRKAAALDSTVQFGMSYEYSVQRIERISIGGHNFELAGSPSIPILVNVVDSFPPAIPSGLAAVFAGDDRTIDLSWTPDTESDLAGYIVYRKDGSGEWMRISPLSPVIGPAYRDTAVVAGHAYTYGVSAIDITGHESKRSAEATETVPNP
jgi:hypothetical protein